MESIESLEKEYEEHLQAIAIQANLYRLAGDELDKMNSQSVKLHGRINLEKKNPKQVHVEAINKLLEQAKQALIQAGNIGVEHSISFTFTTPNGRVEKHNWRASDCYGEEDWYGYERD